jgi:bacteriocin leader peptide (microcyclamide/patellamide family)
MNHKSITPNPQQPVDRVPTGQLPSALAELSEAELSARGVLPSWCGSYAPLPKEAYEAYRQQQKEQQQKEQQQKDANRLCTASQIPYTMF